MTRWQKSYVIYLLIVAPFLALTALFIHQSLVRAVAYGAISFGGLVVKDCLQRKIWP